MATNDVSATSPVEYLKDIEEIIPKNEIDIDRSLFSVCKSGAICLKIMMNSSLTKNILTSQLSEIFKKYFDIYVKYIVKKKLKSEKSQKDYQLPYAHNIIDQTLQAMMKLTDFNPTFYTSYIFEWCINILCDIFNKLTEKEIEVCLDNELWSHCYATEKLLKLAIWCMNTHLISYPDLIEKETRFLVEIVLKNKNLEWLLIHMLNTKTISKMLVESLFGYFLIRLNPNSGQYSSIQHIIQFVMPTISEMSEQYKLDEQLLTYIKIAIDINYRNELYATKNDYFVQMFKRDNEKHSMRNIVYFIVNICIHSKKINDLFLKRFIYFLEDTKHVVMIQNHLLAYPIELAVILPQLCNMVIVCETCGLEIILSIVKILKQTNDVFSIMKPYCLVLLSVVMAEIQKTWSLDGYVPLAKSFSQNIEQFIEWLYNVVYIDELIWIRQILFFIICQSPPSNNNHFYIIESIFVSLLTYFDFNPNIHILEDSNASYYKTDSSTKRSNDVLEIADYKKTQFFIETIKYILGAMYQQHPLFLQKAICSFQQRAYLNSERFFYNLTIFFQNCDDYPEWLSCLYNDICLKYEQLFDMAFRKRHNTIPNSIAHLLFSLLPLEIYFPIDPSLSSLVFCHNIVRSSILFILNCCYYPYVDYQTIFYMKKIIRHIFAAYPHIGYTFVQYLVEFILNKSYHVIANDKKILVDDTKYALIKKINVSTSTITSQFTWGTGNLQNNSNKCYERKFELHNGLVVSLLFDIVDMIVILKQNTKFIIFHYTQWLIFNNLYTYCGTWAHEYSSRFTNPKNAKIYQIINTNPYIFDMFRIVMKENILFAHLAAVAEPILCYLLSQWHLNQFIEEISLTNRKNTSFIVNFICQFELFKVDPKIISHFFSITDIFKGRYVIVVFWKLLQTIVYCQNPRFSFGRFMLPTIESYKKHRPFSNVFYCAEAAEIWNILYCVIKRIALSNIDHYYLLLDEIAHFNE